MNSVVHNNGVIKWYISSYMILVILVHVKNSWLSRYPIFRSWCLMRMHTKWAHRSHLTWWISLWAGFLDSLCTFTWYLQGMYWYKLQKKKLLQMSRLTSVSFPTFYLKQLDLGIPSQLFPTSVITLQIFIIACFLGANVCWSSAQCLLVGGKWPLGIWFFSAHFSCFAGERQWANCLSCAHRWDPGPHEMSSSSLTFSSSWSSLTLPLLQKTPVSKALQAENGKNQPFRFKRTLYMPMRSVSLWLNILWLLCLQASSSSGGGGSHGPVFPWDWLRVLYQKIALMSCELISLPVWI